MKNSLNELRRIINNSLPGEAAQLRMAPEGREQLVLRYRAKKAAQKSAVLLLLYPVHKSMNSVADWQFPLILRPADGTVHGGQVSLPGGKQEEIDINHTRTALRETEEELGIPAKKIQIIGALTPLYIPPSNFEVFPIVGYIDRRPEFLPDPLEVVRILENPVSELMDENNYREEIWTIGEEKRLVPFFHLCGEKVWGATAMILSEFSSIVSSSLQAR